jgi:hypothetical protein
MSGTGAGGACNSLLQGKLRRIEIEGARGDPFPGGFDLREDDRNIEAAVGGSVGPEPPRRLLQLPRRGHGTTAPGLVPGDGDMDEALEEIPLLGGRRAPCVLELLVRLEVPLRPNCLDSTLERRLHPF